MHTVGSLPGSRFESGAVNGDLPAFGRGKSYPPDIPAEREAYVVDFKGKSRFLSNVPMTDNRANYMAQELAILYIP